MQQDEFDSQDSVTYEQYSKIHYVNVKRHISEPKSLLQGFGFQPYYPKIVFDAKLDYFVASKGTSKTNANTNKLDDLLFEKLEKKEKQKNVEENSKDQENGEGTYKTLAQRYSDKVPLYSKFGGKNKKYFASEIVSLKPGRKVTKSIHKQPLSYDNIQIDSGFQFGNLCKAYKVGNNSYQLILQNDINTKGNNQWFFFRVKGTTKNSVLKFQIMNLIKRQSLFNEGMKPTVFSKVRYETKGVGWVREGERVEYFPNTIKKQHRQGHFYSLSFEYKVVNQQDEIYFSHSYPYTYSDLNQYMKKIFLETYSYVNISLGIVGETIAGNRVDVVTITGKNYNKNKKVVWILGRQHPGEITSSYVVEGIINTLLSNNEWIKYLRENVIFKIVPMINPDGVIHGNSRCELIGVDPNRRWRNPSKNFNPVIHNLKQMITKNANSNTDMVLDLHSHSRKLGTFFYGNSDKEKEKSRVYPLIVCQNDERFSFNSSRFSEGPKSTARYALHKLLGISNVFTVESSFYGYEKNSRIIEYLPDDYRDLGRSLLEGYAMMLNQQEPKLQKLNFATAYLKLQEQPELMEQGDRLSAGSDSDPSGDELDIKQLQRILPKKLELNKKKKKVIKRKPQTKQFPINPVKQQSKPPEIKQQAKKQTIVQIRKKSASLLPLPRKYSTSTTRKRQSFQQDHIVNNSSKCIQTQEAPLFRQINRSGDCLGRLMIVGQKVEDREIWVEGNNQIGVQSGTGSQGNNSNKMEAKRPPRMFKLLSELKENRTYFRDCSKRH